MSKSLGHGKTSEKRGDDGLKTERVRKDSETANLISGFFRLLGLESPRIAAIAVNSVIFLAQMVRFYTRRFPNSLSDACELSNLSDWSDWSKTLLCFQQISSLFDVNSTPDESEGRSKQAPFNPMEFIVDNKNERVRKIAFLLNFHSRNSTLSAFQIQNLLYQAQDPALPAQLIDTLDGFDTACIRLLICKASPIILAAQNSLRNGTIGPAIDLTSWLPERDIFEENADSCEEKHKDCKVFPESR